MSDKKPDFFIIGAPKCGTTALSEYLTSHPRIFMSVVKEPHFFSRDFWQYASEYYKSLDDYLSLFASAPDDAVALGEASVFYAFSDVAVHAIRKFNPDAKLIMMVRNPVDVVHSLHGQYVYNSLNFETEPDFELAWRLQDERRQGNALPVLLAQATDRAAELLQYRLVARMGEQLEQVFKTFPREQVHVIVFDDFVANTQSVYEGCLKFLNVPSDNRTTFTQVNANKVRRFSTVHAWVKQMTSYKPLIRVWRHVKRALHINSLSIRHFVEKQTTVYQDRTPLSADLRAELVICFRDDVMKLESLLERDFSHWQ